MRTVLFSILFLLGSYLHAQTISGYITDSQTGEKLIGANIYDINTGKGAITNQYGFYSLRFKSSSVCNLQVSYIGYKTETLNINLLNDTLIHFQLTLNNKLEEVVVTAKRPIEERIEMSVVEISMKQLETLPMLAGEVDIIKAMQLMPGIKSGSEGQSNMFVRGGSHDQNLILLDDVPLYYINHLGGFVSVFNTDAINSFKLYKGSFLARYGGRLSSIMDVRMKDGNLKERHTNLTIGMISSKLQIEGPIKKDTASYMISGRRLMYDLISRPITWLTNDKRSTGYTFYDLNAKFNYKFSDKNRLFLSFYWGDDKILSKKKEKEDGEKEEMKNETKWGNFLTAIRWNHIFNNHFFGNITANYTKYRYKSEFSFLSEQTDETYETVYSFSSGINDICVKSDFEYFFSNYTFRFGSNHVHHTFNPNITSLKQTGYTNVDTSFNTTQYRAWDNSIYLENEFTLIKHISLNIGVRALLYHINSKSYNNIEPRLLININIPNVFSIKGSYCQMQQYVHLLTYSGAGLPGDLWMPTTENVPLQKSEIIAVGIAKSLLNNKLELSVEAYYKTMYDLIDYRDGAGFAGSNTKDWQQLIETRGWGKSKGLEFLVQKNQGKLNGWISYTLSRTTRQFDNINNGKEYLFTYDATHDFSITSNYYLKENLYLSLSWVYMTGRAITLPNEHFETLRLAPEILLPDPSSPEPETEKISITTYYEKNNVRMHHYHRLDLGLTYKKHKKRSDRILSLSIYNVYNRQNPYYYYTTFDEIEDENGIPTGQYEKKTYQRSLFPFIPSISYTWKF